MTLVINKTTRLFQQPGLTKCSVKENEMADESVAEVEYRDIPGFPGYRVGNDGTAWSCWKPDRWNGPRQSDEWKQLKGCPDIGGYLKISLYRDGKMYSRAIHRMVLEAFVGPCPKGMEACHAPNPDRTCNMLSNLRWDTRKANGRDKVVHGHQKHGEMLPWAKLTAADAVAIREAYAAGNSTFDLAKQYGIAPSNVAGIIKGATWLRAGGPIQSGNLRPNKLTADKVRAIRSRHAAEGTKALAAEFGVAENTIVYIMLGKRWRHVA